MTGYALARATAILGRCGSDYPMSPQERARFDRLRRHGDRRDFIAVRLLARRLVAKEFGAHETEVSFHQWCAVCAGPHGPPRMHDNPRISVSWSHDNGWVAACVADGPCGIDVVATEFLTPASLPRHALSAREQQWCQTSADPVGAFAQLWTRKEVLVKAGRLRLDDAAGVDVLDARGAQPADVILGVRFDTVEAGAPAAVASRGRAERTPAPGRTCALSAAETAAPTVRELPQ